MPPLLVNQTMNDILSVYDTFHWQNELSEWDNDINNKIFYMFDSLYAPFNFDEFLQDLEDFYYGYLIYYKRLNEMDAINYLHNVYYRVQNGPCVGQYLNFAQMTLLLQKPQYLEILLEEYDFYGTPDLCYKLLYTYGQMVNNGVTIFPQIEDIMDTVRLTIVNFSSSNSYNSVNSDMSGGRIHIR